MRAEFVYDCAPRYTHLCVLNASRSTGKERDTESGLDNFDGWPTFTFFVKTDGWPTFTFFCKGGGGKVGSHSSSLWTPSAGVTQYAYDTENNLLSITDAKGHATTFTYDAFGRVTQTAFPSSLAESYAYDAIGNLTSKTDRKGQTIQYVYDALNRLSSKDYPDSTSVEYLYDLGK